MPKNSSESRADVKLHVEDSKLQAELVIPLDFGGEIQRGCGSRAGFLCIVLALTITGVPCHERF